MSPIIETIRNLKPGPRKGLALYDSIQAAALVWRSGASKKAATKRRQRAKMAMGLY